MRFEWRYSEHNITNKVSRGIRASLYQKAEYSNDSRRKATINIQFGGDTMSTNRNILTSPVGEIQFMAAVNPITDRTGREAYNIKLAFKLEQNKEWLDSISDINHAKVVTAQTYRGKSDAVKAKLAEGYAMVEAKTNYKPMVFDAAGNEMEENPMFFAESTGTAQMMYSEYQGENGGTINLEGIKIHSLDNPEGSGTGVDREARLAQLRDLARQG